MKEEPVVIGVDLGGTHVWASVVNVKGEVLCKCEKDVDVSLPSEKIIKECVIPVIKEAISKSPPSTKVYGVGIGVPGRHDSKRGICHFSPNFGWKNVPVTPPIEEEIGIPVYMLNDVGVQALGEKHFGGGKGIDNFVMCAIGTGIGGGIVVNGEILLGTNESAGEIGHITVLPNGPLCNCGNKGCLEALASGPAIARRVKKAMDENKESLLWYLTKGDKSLVTPLLVYEAAKKGDKLSLKIWEETGIYLGIAFANIIHTLDPKIFLIGGRVSGAMEFFLPSLIKEMEKRATMVEKGSVKVKQAHLKENAGIIGAAALAFEKTKILP